MTLLCISSAVSREQMGRAAVRRSSRVSSLIFNDASERVEREALAQSVKLGSWAVPGFESPEYPTREDSISLCIWPSPRIWRTPGFGRTVDSTVPSGILWISTRRLIPDDFQQCLPCMSV